MKSSIRPSAGASLKGHYMFLSGSSLKHEPCHEKTCFLPYANNKGADQPALPCSLISAFVVCCLDSIIPILAKSKVLRLYLVFVA